ncbi:N-acetylmuramidase domain-containing protein [Aquabacterium sp.]|uniref:LysM peptidoglycan-binding domain-containing protein n=1 Tax=Aquabacterium sp. TaxID=1872578 RepID=UPI0024873E2E|nr:N-acetylmuramidase domain-containing protein [Aquabacterium sp.]MDI1261603.1 N-acetylmuramidase domain-containing protein [Aquabacterium sp.]
MTTMNESRPTTPLSDPYGVRRGDTLSKISARCGRTVAELMRFNALTNGNRIAIGQTLYLSESTAFGASVLFLDSLRHPINKLRYRVAFDERKQEGTTGANGLIPAFITGSARSRIKVWIQEADGAWQQVAHVSSDYGHKLVTLTSNALVVASTTRQMAADALHDLGSALETGAHSLTTAQSPAPAPTTGKSSKNNPAVKTRQTRGVKGQPIVKIEVDLPPGLLDLFGKYSGHEIAEENWREAAKQLECEPEVLKAFSDVESGGKSSFWRLNKGDGANVPALLFERHYFSRLTKGRFDSAHPDLSWPVAYRKKSLLGQDDKRMHDGKVDATDVYSDYASSYLRLINAYRLDPDAALRSCSWGKFQIMGDNYTLCGARNAHEFVSAICASEYKQIDLMAQFIRLKPAPWKDPKDKKAGKALSLWDAIKFKDWAMIAFNYNGPGYKTYSYDTKLKAAYEKHKLQKT